MPVDLPSLSNTFDSLSWEEVYMQAFSLEAVRILRERGHMPELFVKLDEKIRGTVEKERDLRTKMRDRESLLQSRVRELEGAATATEGLRKELEDANNMVTKLQDLREGGKGGFQNQMTSMEEKHKELVSELEKKVKLRQELLDEFERERKRIQDEEEKQKRAEKEVMDATLEEERRVARRQLERVEREHLKREEDLEGQLKEARERAVTAEANLHEQQQKEQPLLNQLEQVREQAKETETMLQQRLRKEQEEREEEQERFRVAIEEEKARVRQEFYSGFFEEFTKEKALLIEGVRKNIHEMREDIKKELKMKTEEKGEEDILILSEAKLEGEEGSIVGEEWDSDVARD